jgi:type VI secretion system secreted protein VgrG
MPPVQAPELVAGLFGDIHGVEYRFSTTAEDQPAWSVRTLSIVENISVPYAIELELGSEEPPRKPAAMLGKSCTLTFSKSSERSIHGIVASIEDGVATAALTVVHLTIVPAFSALGHVTSSRIFSEIAIGELALSMLEEELKPFKRTAALDLMQAEYPKREYLVQHRESDRAFLERLLAEQGLWYYFNHPAGEDQAEHLVITDSPQKAPPIAEDPELELLRERERSPTQEAITRFALRDAIGTSGVRVRHFNWTHPEVMEEVEKSVSESSGLALGAYEHGDVAGFDYAAPRYRKHDTDAQAQLRLDRHQRERHVYRGESNAMMMRPGHFVRVEGKEYLITHVLHTGSTVFNTGSAAHRGEYSNSFECVPRELAYRPALPEKPRIVGVQTAIVVGRNGGIEAPSSSAEGEDIVTDEHGRVRVKFHWDLSAAGEGGTNSCWVRVAQGWAGQGWGTQFIPRVGMEVVVQFVDGDPDRPLITGCVYNGLNPPPYKDKPTQSGIKTASSVDPSRYNELRFEDAKEKEQIFVRAQKDYVEEVLHNHTTTVHGDQSQTVKGSQTESVNGSQSLSVGGKRSKTVKGAEDIQVKEERTTTVTKKHTETFEDAHEVTVTKSVTETYKDSHDRSVTGTQKFEAKADKLEHVVGTYELTTDKSFVLNQGATKLTYEGEKVALDAANNISVKLGGASIDVDTGGNIAVKTMGAITLEVGPNKLSISASGIELNGMQISAKAGPSELALTPATASLTSVNTTVEATAICAIRGTATVTLN